MEKIEKLDIKEKVELVVPSSIYINPLLERNNLPEQFPPKKEEKSES